MECLVSVFSFSPPCIGPTSRVYRLYYPFKCLNKVIDSQDYPSAKIRMKKVSTS